MGTVDRHQLNHPVLHTIRFVIDSGILHFFVLNYMTVKRWRSGGLVSVNVMSMSVVDVYSS